MNKLLLCGIILYSPLNTMAFSSAWAADESTSAENTALGSEAAPAQTAPALTEADVAPAVSSWRTSWQKPWTSLRSSMDFQWAKDIREGKVPPDISAAAVHAACVAKVASTVASLGWTSAITVPYHALTMPPAPESETASPAMRLLRISAGGLFGAATLQCIQDLYKSLADRVAAQTTPSDATPASAASEDTVVDTSQQAQQTQQAQQAQQTEQTEQTEQVGEAQQTE